MQELLLYGRPACHLCDEMQDDLETLLGRGRFRLRVENVDSRPDWRERYGSRIPVLCLADGTELCHFRLDPAAVRQGLGLR